MIDCWGHTVVGWSYILAKSDNHWLIDWGLVNWLIDWLIEYNIQRRAIGASLKMAMLIDSGWLIDYWWIDRLVWLIDQVRRNSLNDWLLDVPPLKQVIHHDWLTDWLIDWLIVGSMKWLIQSCSIAWEICQSLQAFACGI